MLKKITFKQNDDNVDLLFDKVNIIVGEKGSGKSTLLKIIAEAILNKTVVKNGEKWLDENANLKLDSVEIDNGVFLANDFSSFFEKESKESKENGIKKLQDKLPGFIEQNDSRKTALESTSEVENQKEKCAEIFFNEIINNKEDKFFEQFEELRELMRNYHNNNEKSISFHLAFDSEIKNLLKQGDKNSLSAISIDNDVLKSKLKLLKNKLDEKSESIKRMNDEILSIKNDLNNLENDEINDLFEESEIKKLNDLTKLIAENNLELSEIYNSFSSKANKYLIFLKTFEYAFEQSIKRERENKDKQTNKINDINKINDYFKNMAIVMTKIRDKYDEISKNEIFVDWNKSFVDKNNKNLEYRLEAFTLSDEDKSEILNKYLKSSNKTQTFIDLFSTDIFSKNFTQDIKKMILKKLIKNNISIYAGNKKYADLSNGERTLFGITHTIESLKDEKNSEYLLLDQIEDNLDNRTIYTKIVPLLKKQIDKNRQIFIVTHNPNIGILLNGSTISTDIFSDELGKKFIKNQIIKNNDTIDTPESYYLEGGFKALKEREKIIENKLKEDKK
ncbi:hypothetical protein [Metamycoplasma equirhinis]|uniref:hypothetical protein n=1 Tax=Metamycoplasma equirhinis TaxID=92402 RepID=UPI00359C7360